MLTEVRVKPTPSYIFILIRFSIISPLFICFPPLCSFCDLTLTDFYLTLHCVRRLNTRSQKGQIQTRLLIISIQNDQQGVSFKASWVSLSQGQQEGYFINKITVASRNIQTLSPLQICSVAAECYNCLQILLLNYSQDPIIMKKVFFLNKK